MSLRWRIMGATVLVVLLTASVSVGVGYYATQARLGVFVEKIGNDEAVQLSQNLSREYTATGGWETVNRALAEGAYPDYAAPASERSESSERSEEGEENHSEFSHQDPVRVVIAGIDGRVVKDNFSELPSGAVVPNLEGHRETVFNLVAGEPVGYVYVDVNSERLSSESHGFLRALLFITVLGGAITAGLATLLAAWLSNRITAPVKALTDATQAIAQGDAIQLPVSSSDELGRMSVAFNHMTSTLQTQRDLRRRLISDVSHELNTPLSVIQLEASGLRDGLQTPESGSDHIIQEVDRLKGLVHDLSWLAETDHGHLQLSLETGSVNELVAAEAERWRPQCQAKQIDLSLRLSGDLPSMQLDSMRLSQTLGNIIGNAVHCTGPYGTIVLEASIESEGFLAISIADDGIGMDPAEIPYVFDRFYRTGQSRSHGIRGTGLGLAIARTIVEAHGGTIAITSDGFDQGTTVTIRFPRKV